MNASALARIKNGSGCRVNNLCIATGPALSAATTLTTPIPSTEPPSASPRPESKRIDRGENPNQKPKAFPTLSLQRAFQLMPRAYFVGKRERKPFHCKAIIQIYSSQTLHYITFDEIEK